MEPQSTKPVAELPVGLTNFSCEVLTSLNAELQLFDPRSNSYIIRNGAISPGHRLPLGKLQYKRPIPEREVLVIQDQVPAGLSLRFKNYADEAGIIQMDYVFQGLQPCTAAVPGGCSKYDKEFAQYEVRAWSGWAQAKFRDADVAWRELSARAGLPASAGRRLAKVAAIPWYNWKAVWEYWGQASSASSWQAAFYFLDQDRDEQISEEEFTKGYDLGPPAYKTAMPAWILLAVPLALIAICYYRVYRYVRAKKKKPRSAATKMDFGAPQQEFELPLQQEYTPVVEESSIPEAVTELPVEQAATSLGDATSSLLAYIPRRTREGFCSLTKCAWGRDSKEQAAALPHPPAWNFGFDSTTQEPEQVEDIVRQMLEEPQDAASQEYLCECLEQMALEPNGKKDIAQFRGIEAILTAMSNHREAPGVQEHACAALGNLASQAEDYQIELVHHGAVEAIITAMSTHKASPKAQETACWALRELALTSEGRRQITDSSGIDRVLRAMRNHGGSATLLEHGLMALAYLAYEAEIRRWIAYDGGVSVVLEAMQAVTEDSVVQEAGCLALRNLGCSREPLEQILKENGIEAILQAVRFHPWAPSVQETAFDSLYILSPPVRNVADSQGVEMVIEAMQRHSASAGVQAKACTLLGYLGEADDEVREHIVSSGAVDLIKQAMQSFQSSKEVQDAGDEAVRLLMPAMSLAARM
uniref:EF-hand domain-containing protein n=1 Tax=Pyrodinium bahamense TaxID=73915 RepID=A0A7S0FV67_9DINO